MLVFFPEVKMDMSYGGLPFWRMSIRDKNGCEIIDSYEMTVKQSACHIE